MMKRNALRSTISLFLLLLVVCLARADAKTGIAATKHNLSATGPGELKSLTETRICVFCHTPHNAAPLTPLWNKALEPVNYLTYSSTTLGATPSQPTGPSRLCLSCHDGTVALGTVLRPSGGILTSGKITSSRPSYLGTSLMDDHPVSFSYHNSLPNPELHPGLPSGLLFYGNGTIHCSTCHDSHDNTHGKFLVMSNRYSALCTTCHVKDGWTHSTHRSAAAPLNGVLPLSPRDWPTWTTVGEWGCEGCHTNHSAGGRQRLLYFSGEEENCYLCHKGNVAQKNIYAQFRKPSRHSLEYASGIHTPKESPSLISSHVECADCHNSHAANSTTSTAPYASGKLARTSGTDKNGSSVIPVTYEYEVCFKCHADSTPSKQFSPGYPLPRVSNSLNTRLEFDTSNPSYHPVAGRGRNTDVPSIPGTLVPSLTTSSLIYCTDCHDSDESSSIGGTGPRGPHGSLYAPLLRERYETNDSTIESYQSYALCYRCHNRTSILNDDSFKRSPVSGKGGHSGHLGSNTPCSACHDPHGVRMDGITGDHTHLINFDTRIVRPAPGAAYPTFTDRGSRSGSCTLLCHNVVHSSSSY